MSLGVSKNRRRIGCANWQSELFVNRRKARPLRINAFGRLIGCGEMHHQRQARHVATSFEARRPALGVFGDKTQAVHAGIEFQRDMNPIWQIRDLKPFELPWLMHGETEVVA